MAVQVAWEAPIANVAKMPRPAMSAPQGGRGAEPGTGWTDASGVCVVGMVDRIGCSLGVAVLACTKQLGRAEEVEMGWVSGSTALLPGLDPVFCMQALYATWCHELDHGREPPELGLDPKRALAAVQADPALSVVYARCLAIAELPQGLGGANVPTFSLVMGAIRDDFRTIFGRDVRVDSPNPPGDAVAVAALSALVATGAAVWYFWRRHA